MNTGIDPLQTSKEAHSVPNHDDNKKIKDSLEYDLIELKRNLSSARLVSIQQKTSFGKWVACIAMIVPLIILVVLLFQLLTPDSIFHKMTYIPQTIFISASFLCFIVIYTMLIKGMFEQKEEDQSPLKEVEDFLRNLRPHDSP